MADSEDVEVDSAMADMMGFSGFGMQKKRKYDANDGFVDPAVSESHKPSKGTGANATPSGTRSKGKLNMAETISENTPCVGDELHSKTTTTKQGEGSGAEPSLEALRNGNVHDSNGHMVIFLPSFLEDPWAGLKPQ